MDIKGTLESCIAALNSMTVTGRHNCTMIAGVCNDLERVIKEVSEDDQSSRQGDVSSAG